MAVENSFEQVQSPLYPFVEYRDIVFQTPINITNTAFDVATDRLYDVRTGASTGFAAQFFNGGAVTINFKIDTTSKSFQSFSELVEADWTELVASTPVSAGAKSAVQEFVRASPKAEAVRIRLSTASGTGIVKGYVGWF